MLLDVPLGPLVCACAWYVMDTKSLHLDQVSEAIYVLDDNIE